jgi:hypothetical protein
MYLCLIKKELIYYVHAMVIYSFTYAKFTVSTVQFTPIGFEVFIVM